MAQQLRRLTAEQTPWRWVGVYREPDVTVVLAREEAWWLHEASLPRRVQERAKLDPPPWQRWQAAATAAGLDRVQFRAFLYGATPPQAEVDKYRAAGFWHAKEPRVADTAIVAFRGESSQRAVSRAALKLARTGSPTTKTLRVQSEIEALKRVDPKADCLIGWMCRGEDPPEGWRVLTRDLTARLCGGLDHRRRGSTDAYQYWFSRQVFPATNHSELYEWVAWLFGARAPAGWFIINEAMIKVREAARTVPDAAGLSSTTHKYWLRTPKHRELLEGLLKAPQSAQRGLLLTADPRLRSSMGRYARHAQLSSVLQRCDLRQARYDGFLQTAALLGDDCRSFIQQFLKGQTLPKERGAGRLPCGVIGPKVFCPTAEMLAFHEASRTTMSKYRVWQLKELPAFQQIIIDLALPRPVHGKRPYADLLRSDLSAIQAESAAEPKSNGLAAGTGKAWDAPTLARNKYCYEQLLAGVHYKAIVVEIKKNKDWDPLHTKMGVRKAAERYAAKFAYPPLPSRQSKSGSSALKE